jgi:hypothetical protein
MSCGGPVGHLLSPLVHVVADQLQYVEVQVSANACAMTVCGLMLENILDAASEFISPIEQACFVYSCLGYAERYVPHSKCIVEGFICHVLHCCFEFSPICEQTPAVFAPGG